MTDNVPVVPNHSATYADQRSQSVIANRSHVKIAPKYGGEFKSGSIIRIEIPSQDWLDPDLFSISFSAEIFQKDGKTIPSYGTPNGENPQTQAQSKFCGFDTPLQLIFNRIKLLQGSTVVEDIQDYGTLFKLLSLSTVNRPYLETMGAALEGHYDVKDYDMSAEAKRRHGWGDVTNNFATSSRGWYYNIRPLLGLFRSGKYLPLKWMGQLTLELYCESNEQCLVSSTSSSSASQITEAAAGPTTFPVPVTTASVIPPTKECDFPGAYYVLSQVNAECHFVQPIEEYDRSALALIEEKGLEIWFDTFSTHVRQLSASSGRTTNSFQERSVSLKGGYAIMQNNEDINDYRSPISFPDNQMEEYQWKIGSQYLPAQPLRCTYGAGLALGQLQNSFDAFGDLATTGTIDSHNFTGSRIYTDAGISTLSGTTLTNAGNININGTTIREAEILNETSLPNSFIMALNLERSPDQLSGFNSAAASVDVELITKTLSADNPSLNVGYGTFRDASVLSAGHQLQPSKFLNLHSYQTGRPAGSTSDVPISNYKSSTLKEMVTKPANKFSRLTFYAHIDAVIKISRVGNLEIMR
jgi:hypothetical protein